MKRMDWRLYLFTWLNLWKKSNEYIGKEIEKLKFKSNGLQGKDFLFRTMAALVAVFVNFGGTFVIVFQAANAAGLSPELTASWVFSLSVGIGITGIFLSYKYKEPIITAWSTPASAFLVTALVATSYEEAIGAYIITAI